MALFSNLEYTDVVSACGEARGKKMFFKKSPKSLLPNVRTFKNVVQLFQEYESFKLAAQDRGRLRSNRIANIEEAVSLGCDVRSFGE